MRGDTNAELEGGPISRAAELQTLLEVVDRVRSPGAAVLISGEPGAGKTTLLDHAGQRARRKQENVLATAGVATEAELPYAGLDRLLASADQRPTVAAPTHEGLGRAGATSDDPRAVARAMLDWLRETARATPVVIVADDAHLLDTATRQVLAFIGRRVEREAVVVLMAARDHARPDLDRSGFEDMRLARLSPAVSAELLDQSAPWLEASIRGRVLEACAGNPLALRDIPLAIHDMGWIGAGSEPMPLTDRLIEAFSPRLPLSDGALTLLLVAALSRRRRVGDIMAAAARLIGAAEAEEALAAAPLEAFGDELRFDHPLVPAAVIRCAGSAARRAAHLALAEALAYEADRSVRHRAAAAAHVDDALAGELEQAATRRAPTDAAEALEYVERAAMLSGESDARLRRLLRAAELALECGLTAGARAHLAAAVALEPGVLGRARAAGIGERLSGEDPTARLILRHVRAAADAGDRSLALDLALVAALRIRMHSSTCETCEQVRILASDLGPHSLDPRYLVIQAAAARPTGVPNLRQQVMRAHELDDGSATGWLVGLAAYLLGDCELALTVLHEPIDLLRAQGRMTLLAQALTVRSWSAVETGNWPVVAAAAEEAVNIASAGGQEAWAAAARASAAVKAAVCGDDDGFHAAVTAAERYALPRHMGPILSMLQLARGLAALADRSYAEAYQHLARTQEPADCCYHDRTRYQSIAYLVGAAVQSGHTGASVTAVEELERLACETGLAGLRVRSAHARALVSDGAVDADDPTPLATQPSWPFLTAWGQLLLGARLRRSRRVSDSRAHLRTAVDVFDGIDAAPWAAWARQELRASGQTVRRRDSVARDELTPQELQIALMAAEGLSNREIGSRIFLSHRTVGSHLYRLFPKLGISSRAELGAAIRDLNLEPV